ncbi:MULTISPECIES: DUF1822 family protein [unclassified Nostoc]|uniref:DUF1822 family protein n=1 Tax=unclassified Nostoc TaxID=2593658 RepID=UPI000DECC53D|nr:MULTISPECIES: DUF1822 family protein [unclassified Nostoc]MBD2507431.1 DUF1822 family protein [Desmonostoc muscorum FACHB-395]QHG14700.1 DUF1822 family protein [Nostoc sp. ATCC 53789]QLE46871.1 DUF1822 family protein [Nostoc sp. C057]RCJ35824.1 hypothetical protein A6V25_00455 [Nostoc sp. ATCC 53789]
MNNSTYQLDDFALTLPIPQLARITAQEFANQQPNSEKAEQVRLNTLAVWVVNDYLEMMDIPTNLQASDSWNPIMRLCGNVADLELPSVGRLECRPVHQHQQICSIPPETWEERVGYLVVQFDELLQEARLLGFIASVATETLPLKQLQPLEAFIDHLGELRQSPVSSLVNLSQWFTGIFEAGWQTIESLWNLPELRPVYAFRSTETLELNALNQAESITKRAKLIDLGIQILNQPVMLIVEISPEKDQQTSIHLQLHATGNQIYLPPGVHLTVLDSSGAVFLDAQSRKSDNYIQLQFRGEPTEQFSVRVAINDTSITEHFRI